MNITIFFIISTLLTGMVVLLDRLVFAKRRIARGVEEPGWLIDLSRSVFPVLLIVLFIRSFLIQPYRVPTGSLEPTVLPGDFIFVNQFAYGVRLPLVRRKIMEYGEPHRGDIVLFYWPPDPSEIYVKRVVGLPGDHIAYHNKTLFVNGKKAEQELIGKAYAQETETVDVPVIQKKENLLGKVHDIFVSPDTSGVQDFEKDVPAGHYFMMGDNRDASYDSRYWGLVEERYLIGKALVIWMSWDSKHFGVRWHRLGKLLH